MRKWLFQLACPVIIIGLSFGVVRSFSSKRPPVEKTPSARRDRPKPSTQVMRPQFYPGSITVKTNGVATPRSEVRVSAQSDGLIVYKHADLQSGCLVSKGQTLLRIDSRDHQLKLKELKAEQKQVHLKAIAASKDIELLENRITLLHEVIELRNEEEQRLAKLVAATTITKTDYAKAREATLNSRESLLELQAKLVERRSFVNDSELEIQTLESRIEQAQLNLERTIITSPLDGIVTASKVENGAFVRTGELLLTIEDTSAIEIACSLRSNEIDLVRGSQLPFSEATYNDSTNRLPDMDVPQLPARITFLANGIKRTWKGSLCRIEGSGVDPKTRLLPCRVLVRNPRGNENAIPLLRGMFVSVEFQFVPQSQPLIVPKSAVRSGQTVWILHNHQLRSEKVRTVETRGDSLLVMLPGMTIPSEDHILLSTNVPPVNGLTVDQFDVSPPIALIPFTNPDHLVGTLLQQKELGE